MSKQQLFSFMVSALCFLCMIFTGFIMDVFMAKIFTGFIMDVSMAKIFILLLLMTASLVNLYFGLKGFVSESEEITKNKEVG